MKQLARKRKLKSMPAVVPTTWLLAGLLFADVAGVGALKTDAAPLRWDCSSDTWVATDALGRSVPGSEEVGPRREGRFVGIFYFLWLGQHGDLGPFDISKILASDARSIANPDSPLWGPMHAPHHWGESVFGYYVSDDEGVLRKHAQMLADADLDVVIFDVTNQLTYPRSWQALCRVFDQVRREGNRCPQIAFLCPFGDPAKVVRELWDQLYSANMCPDLWFRWNGKPLILADPAMLGETISQREHDTPTALEPGHTLGQVFTVDRSFRALGGSFPTWMTTNSAMTLTLRANGPSGRALAERRFEKVIDNAWLCIHLTTPLGAGTYYLEMSQPGGRVGWWTSSKDTFAAGHASADGHAVRGDRTLRVVFTDDRDARILEFFTFRKPQPDYFVGPTGPDQWGWLEVHPQHVFHTADGAAEQMTVGVAQNAVDGKLSVLSNPRSHGRSFHDGKEPAPEGQDHSGRNFAEQWRRALEVNPPFIFITGWNEWIAGRFDNKAPFHAPGPVTFVDQFNLEYSRDIEPMKGGHEDTYYYQMVSNIRHFKGARPLQAVASHPINIDGQFSDWDSVTPEFRDTIGDPVQRDHPGWSKGMRYVNRTGRNDLVSAKVSGDASSICFYVRTREPLTPATDPNWMLLFLNVDRNPTNGWLGYDFVVNRSGIQPGRTTLERHSGTGYQWASPIAIGQRASSNEIELAIPRSALGLGSGEARIDFKWADNIRQTGDWSDFTLNGDVAPNDRFNFRAILPVVR